MRKTKRGQPGREKLDDAAKPHSYHLRAQGVVPHTRSKLVRVGPPKSDQGVIRKSEVKAILVRAIEEHKRLEQTMMTVVKHATHFMQSMQNKLDMMMSQKEALERTYREILADDNSSQQDT